jgi:type IV pilus assembly protein PilY1
MSKTIQRIIATGTGMIWMLLALATANADDTEIFVGNDNPAMSAKPNILFILDDSSSMDGEVVTQANYDPSTIYPGGTCNADPGRVYWTTNGSPPSCDTSNWFAISALKCRRALDALAANQGGSYQDNFAQYDPDQERWERISSYYQATAIECADDLPDPAVGWAGHGDGSDPSKVYPRDGDRNALWTSDESSPNRITWGTWPTDRRYDIYSGNYMNWYYGEPTTSTRIAVMKEVAINLINSINGVNVGLMHFNSDEGGSVSHAVEEVATARPSMTAAINDLSAGGATPLSETLYEAYLYMRGGLVDFGTDSVAASRRPPPDDNQYQTPIDLSCQKNHIVLLTDGEPTQDHSADADILGLVDAEGRSFSDLVGNSCDAETYPADFNPDGGECLDELAEFMHTGDMSSLPGQQSITTHTVGFLVDLPILEETAARGGGEYQTATDRASLTAALTNILTGTIDTQATFTAPSISINAFNQTRQLDDIYVGLFRPSSTAHWPGNLKKFRLRTTDSTIVDANDMPIVDPATGVFADYVQDFWSASPDGTDVTAGGAANQIPAARNVYTYLGDPQLTSASNRIESGNLDDSLLGTGDPGLPTAQNVIDFINGVDVGDVDQDGNRAESRNQLGDPLHSPPTVVVYGPTNDDALVFMGTNDGMLHAIHVDNGSEAWAFLPPEFLDQQVGLLVDNTTDHKSYGVDGSIRVQTIADNDGVIEKTDGERVLLFFGMRRGGDAYYALDVTDPDAPQVLWSKHSGNGSDDLPGLGQSWSSVTPTRIDIQGAAQNQYKLALVVGGGYDASQDAVTASTDAAGNSIYILDTLTGKLLWRGTNSGGTQNFSSANWSMDYSIPADVRVIDLNGDGFADRMYAADMGGQIWRFDITNGNTASSLIAGGVIARLGAAGLTSPSVEETRRFYYAPDVALVVNKDYNFMHVGIGSGHRAHPNSIANHDEFYALRDYSTFASKTQAQYDAFIPIVPGDLVDVTTELAASVPQGSPGWRLSLDDGGWGGEKVLAEARTFDGDVYFSTYRPGINGVSCEPGIGTARQYVVSLINAAPVNNLDRSVEDYNGDGIVDPADLQLTDRYREFQGPPPPETVFFFPSPEQDTDGDGQIDSGLTLDCVNDGDCLGETPCQGLICFESNSDEPRYPTRTFWSEDDID